MGDAPPVCEHSGFVVNAEEREVRCSSCGVILDPIGTLVRLEEMVAEFERQRDHLAHQQAAQRERQEFAIRQKMKKQLQAARAHCELCGGSGWAPAQNGVVRCPCTRAIHAMSRRP
jgi:hypothetical protein